MADELAVEPKRGPARPRKSEPEAAPAEPERPAPQMSAQAKWEAQPECPSCHARPGYNPATGVWVRSWDAASKKFIEGHKASCLTLAKPVR